MLNSGFADEYLFICSDVYNELQEFCSLYEFSDSMCNNYMW